MKMLLQSYLLTITTLESLSCLSGFALGGGSALVMRYNHRIPDRIEMLCPQIIGNKVYKIIENELKQHFGTRVYGFEYPCQHNDQFQFLRFYVRDNVDEAIKIELFQNIKNLDEFEMLNGIRIYSNRDTGVQKLVSAGCYGTSSDIYDLDYITDTIPLVQLYKNLNTKTALFDRLQDMTIFDLEQDSSPLDDPSLLLKFLNPSATNSHDLLQILPGHKSWLEARSSWLSKVRELYQYLDKDFPILAKNGTY